MFRFCVAFILTVEMISLALLPLLVSETLVLFLAPLVLLTVLLAFILYPRFGRVSYRAWRLTPENITTYNSHDELEEVEPILLSRFIVERAKAIRRAMLGPTSEAQVEICALGYRACVNDMITLTHTVNEELPNADLLRRMKLNRARRRATEALSGARKALPPDALRTRHQEKQ